MFTYLPQCIALTLGTLNTLVTCSRSTVARWHSGIARFPVQPLPTLAQLMSQNKLVLRCDQSHHITFLKAFVHETMNKQVLFRLIAYIFQ